MDKDIKKSTPSTFSTPQALQGIQDLKDLEDLKDLKDLTALETELMSCMSSDRHTWVKMYKLMDKVDKEGLYKQAGLRCFTAWVNQMAERCGVHVSLLWARLKAGRVYEDFERRSSLAGRTVPSLDALPASISPDSLSLCCRVGGSNTNSVDSLVAKVLDGELTREDLREAARAKRRTSSNDPVRSVGSDDDASGGSTGITAADIVTALRHPEWLTGLGVVRCASGGLRPEQVRRSMTPPVYHLLTEVSADSGTTRHTRLMDAVAAENLTCDRHHDNIKLKLHGIEIKVAESDLRGDHKMGEYVPYVDLFWLAVPDTPQMLQAAEDVRLPEWGVLAISVADAAGTAGDGRSKTRYTVRLVHGAALRADCSGVMREKTLEVIVLRARDFRRGSDFNFDIAADDPGK